MVTAISRMTVGCEDGFAVGTFTFDETVKDQDFVDMMPGRVKDLPVESIPCARTVSECPARR